MEQRTLHGWGTIDRGGAQIEKRGRATCQPIAGGNVFEDGRAVVLSHPWSRERCMDGAQSIEEERRLKNVGGPPANQLPEGMLLKTAERSCFPIHGAENAAWMGHNRSRRSAD